ncbi:hypothetical protein HDU93_003159 [Gonapodya sp. JEL0774]|nr:hypothetical protein HDU93_003159 [Gonapodya sp. JEL0774]
MSSGDRTGDGDAARTAVLEEEFDANYEPTSEEIVEYAAFLGMDPEKDSSLLWIARESLKAPLPPNWKPCQTDDGNIYYFNFVTGESIWDHPCDEYYKKLYENEKIKVAKHNEGSPALGTKEDRTESKPDEQMPKSAGVKSGTLNQDSLSELLSLSSLSSSSSRKSSNNSSPVNTLGTILNTKFQLVQSLESSALPPPTSSLVDRSLKLDSNVQRLDSQFANRTQPLRSAFASEKPRGPDDVVSSVTESGKVIDDKPAQDYAVGQAVSSTMLPVNKFAPDSPSLVADGQSSADAIVVMRSAPLSTSLSHQSHLIGGVASSAHSHISSKDVKFLSSTDRVDSPVNSPPAKSSSSEHSNLNQSDWDLDGTISDANISLSNSQRHNTDAAVSREGPTQNVEIEREDSEQVKGTTNRAGLPNFQTSPFVSPVKTSVESPDYRSNHQIASNSSDSRTNPQSPLDESERLQVFSTYGLATGKPSNGITHSSGRGGHPDGRGAGGDIYNINNHGLQVQVVQDKEVLHAHSPGENTANNLADHDVSDSVPASLTAARNGGVNGKQGGKPQTPVISLNSEKASVDLTQRQDRHPDASSTSEVFPREEITRAPNVDVNEREAIYSEYLGKQTNAVTSLNFSGEPGKSPMNSSVAAADNLLNVTGERENLFATYMERYSSDERGSTTTGVTPVDNMIPHCDPAGKDTTTVDGGVLSSERVSLYREYQSRHKETAVKSELRSKGIDEPAKVTCEHAEVQHDTVKVVVTSNEHSAPLTEPQLQEVILLCMEYVNNHRELGNSSKPLAPDDVITIFSEYVRGNGAQSGQLSKKSQPLHQLPIQADTVLSSTSISKFPETDDHPGPHDASQVSHLMPGATNTPRTYDQNITDFEQETEKRVAASEIAFRKMSDARIAAAEKLHTLEAEKKVFELKSLAELRLREAENQCNVEMERRQSELKRKFEEELTDVQRKYESELERKSQELQQISRKRISETEKEHSTCLEQIREQLSVRKQELEERCKRERVHREQEHELTKREMTERNKKELQKMEDAFEEDLKRAKKSRDDDLRSERVRFDAEVASLRRENQLAEETLKLRVQESQNKIAAQSNLVRVELDKIRAEVEVLADSLRKRKEALEKERSIVEASEKDLERRRLLLESKYESRNPIVDGIALSSGVPAAQQHKCIQLSDSLDLPGDSNAHVDRDIEQLVRRVIASTLRSDPRRRSRSHDREGFHIRRRSPRGPNFGHARHGEHDSSGDADSEEISRSFRYSRENSPGKSSVSFSQSPRRSPLKMEDLGENSQRRRSELKVHSHDYSPRPRGRIKASRRQLHHDNDGEVPIAWDTLQQP